MYFKLSTVVSLLLSTTLMAFELSKEDERIYTSMSLLELLETDIATGTPVSQKFAPAVTSIITADEIRKSGARTLHEALESVPGLHVFPSSAFVMKNNISIRGIHTSINQQVLVLFDGIRINSVFSGAPALHFTMPTSAIHRIEVIRGSGSALYGADAYSGVINVITKSWSNTTDEIGASYGSFNRWETYITKSAEVGEATIALALSLSKSDGDNDRIVTNDAQTNFDNIFGTSASLAPGSLNTEYDRLYFNADINYKNFDFNFKLQDLKDLGSQEGASQALDNDGKINNSQKIFNIKHTNKSLLKDTVIKTNLTYFFYDVFANYTLFPVGATLPFNSDGSLHTFTNGAFIYAGAEETSYRTNINVIYDGIEKHRINSEIGYRYEKTETQDIRNFGAGVVNTGTITDVTGTQFAFQPSHKRRSYYALIQDEYNINDTLSLTSGVRYDKYNDFGSTVNPRLALVWQASNDVTVKTMYAKAFRAPSFGDLYFQNNPVNIGNPNIQPEEIDTYEITLNYSAPVHTKLNIFYYKAEDLIASVANPNGTTTAQNSKNQNGYGLELELEYNINQDFVLRGNYSYQHSKDDDTEERVADAPAHQTFVQLQYHPNANWNVNTQYFYIGKRYRTSTDTRPALKADSLVNLTIERKNILQGLDFTLSARNLFDEDYREPSDGALPNDYPMQGRYIFGEIRYLF